MKISLNEMSIDDKKVQSYLSAYLDRIAHFENFNNNMMMTVYVTSSGDFTAVEANDYRLQFTSSAHKLSETIKSTKTVEPVTYDRFRTRVRDIQIASGSYVG